MNKRIRKKQAKRHGNRCPKCGSGDVSAISRLFERGGRWRSGPHFVTCFTCDPESRGRMNRLMALAEVINALAQD